MKKSTNFIKKEDSSDFLMEQALEKNSTAYKEKMLRKAFPLIVKSKRNLLDLSPLKVS